jgi:hypothetical protein
MSIVCADMPCNAPSSKYHSAFSHLSQQQQPQFACDYYISAEDPSGSASSTLLPRKVEVVYGEMWELADASWTWDYQASEWVTAEKQKNDEGKKKDGRPA